MPDRAKNPRRSPVLAEARHAQGKSIAGLSKRDRSRVIQIPDHPAWEWKLHHAQLKFPRADQTSWPHPRSGTDKHGPLLAKGKPLHRASAGESALAEPRQLRHHLEARRSVQATESFPFRWRSDKIFIRADRSVAVEISLTSARREQPRSSAGPYCLPTFENDMWNRRWGHRICRRILLRLNSLANSLELLKIRRADIRAVSFFRRCGCRKTRE